MSCGIGSEHEDNADLEACSLGTDEWTSLNLVTCPEHS